MHLLLFISIIVVSFIIVRIGAVAFQLREYKKRALCYSQVDNTKRMLFSGNQSII